jgi:uncharacterized protein
VQPFRFRYRRCASILLAWLFVGGSASHAVQAEAGAETQCCEAAERVVANALPPSAVRLTGGPLKHAQDLNARHLLDLEPDRMLAYYRERAGLKPKAPPYGGWDGGGRNLTGHIGGHYLSAVSLMYAATGDPRFKERADRMVSELKEVQDRHGDGYLSALEGGRECFERVSRGDIRSGGFDLNGLWAPWYTLHKTFAGLRDAYRYTGNATALELEVKFAEWADGILAPLSESDIQKMLDTEFGGMNEVLVDLYRDTGDDRWLELSYKFEHRIIAEPLKRQQDILPGKHGNTQIPKLIGSLARYIDAGSSDDLLAAAFFWDRVVQHHSYATGGHGKDEYFGQPDKLNDRIDGRTAETCNVYNMLKLTRRMFGLRPGAQYADFHERALFNHILGSIDPRDGSTCYMVPVGQGVRREYSDMRHSFTCCHGSGMESHALHGHGIYYETGDKLWVNLYAPSTAAWQAMDAELTVETGFPLGEEATLTWKLAAPREFTLALRRPYWTEDGFAVTVNGTAITDLPPPSSYVEITRLWQDGDRVTVALPKTLRLEPLPDNPRRAAILWGPLVLAGDLGPEDERDRPRDIRTGQLIVPVFVAAGRPVSDWAKPVDGEPGVFRTAGVGRPDEVTLVPFYRLHRRTYAAYWDLFTPEEWKAEEAAYAAAQEQRRQLEAATVAYVQPGEMQPERDFGYQGADDAEVVRLMGRAGRKAKSWFSFEMPVDPQHPLALVATYCSGEWRRTAAEFDILVDGQKIGSQSVVKDDPYRFYEVQYPIPARLVEGKQRVTVRFQAKPGSQVAGVFGVRMIRTAADTPNPASGAVGP